MDNQITWLLVKTPLQFFLVMHALSAIGGDVLSIEVDIKSTFTFIPIRHQSISHT